MSRLCIICGHPLRAQIEAALGAGASMRQVGKRFGVDKSAVSRHHGGHLGQVPFTRLPAGDARVEVTIPRPGINSMPAAVVKDLLERELQGVTRRLDRLATKAEKILDNAIRKHDGRTALLAIARVSATLGEIRASLETRAKITGQLATGSTNISNTLVLSGQAADAVVDKFAALVVRGREQATLPAETKAEPVTVDAEVVS